MIDFVLQMDETPKISFSFKSHINQIPGIQAAEKLKKKHSGRIIDW
jgi:hypothetical protein